MSACNYITFNGNCPICNCASVIKMQCHVASSFGGDQRGRFSDRDYQIGDKMIWWEEGDEKNRYWGDDGIKVSDDRNEVTECCYAKCEYGHDLYAVILFQDLTIKSVLDVGKETDWPGSYPK